MDTYTYATVNGAQGHKNVKAWIDKPRKEMQLYAPEVALTDMADVVDILAKIVHDVKDIGAVPAAGIEWMQSTDILDPYIYDEESTGKVHIVLDNTGTISVVAQYRNPANVNEPFTYIGYDGTPEAVMAFMADINFTAHDPEMKSQVEFDSVLNLELGEKTVAADIK